MSEVGVVQVMYSRSNTVWQVRAKCRSMVTAGAEVVEMHSSTIRNECLCQLYRLPPSTLIQCAVDIPIGVEVQAEGA